MSFTVLFKIWLETHPLKGTEPLIQMRKQFFSDIVNKMFKSRFEKNKQTKKTCIEAISFKAEVKVQFLIYSKKCLMTKKYKHVGKRIFGRKINL